MLPRSESLGEGAPLESPGNAHPYRVRPAAVPRKAGNDPNRWQTKRSKRAGQATDRAVPAGGRNRRNRIPKPRVAGAMPAGGTREKSESRSRLPDLSSSPFGVTPRVL